MNIYSLATLGILAMNLSNISIPMDSNSYQEKSLKNSKGEAKAGVTISSYKTENITDEGFDFIIKFSSDLEIISVHLPFWKEGNYDGRIEKNSEVVKIGKNEFKLHIKMKDIGSGTDYVYIGIHPNTSQGSFFLGDVALKLDSTKPNLNTSLSNTNWTNKNINVSATANDNMNIIKNYYFYDNKNNKKQENVYSDPSILVIVGYNDRSGIRDSLVNKYKNLTIIDQADLTSISQLKGYDIVIYDGYAWGIDGQTATWLNQLFDEGASILTNLNDNYNKLAIGSSSAVYDSSGGNPIFNQYINGWGYTQVGSINRFSSKIVGLRDGDGSVYKLSKSSDSFTVLEATYNDGTTAPAVVIKTHENGNKWIHAQTAKLLTVEDTLNRTLDELMFGTMKTRQVYNKSYEISENGTYAVEVEDFSGNKTKKEITVSNIDKTAPTMNISGNPKSWAKSAKLVITANDNLSGIKEIVLPDGNVVKSNTATFTTTNNDNYTFKVVDNAGNEYSETVKVDKVDKSIDDVISIKATMSHLNIDSSRRNLTVTFPSIVDNQSGIKGYSYIIDKNANTEPDNEIDTTSTIIEKEISDTGKYYLHIKAIDNAGNISNTKHFEVEIPKLVTELNKSGTLDLVWDMETTEQPFLYNVLRKRHDETEYSEVKTSELRDKVNILNIHPNAGSKITFNTWDGESVTTTQSGQLKKWMEEPNSENDKGYGMGIIEVIPITQDEFNANPQTYLYKATSGVNKGKYVTNVRNVEEVVDVVMFGTWDSNNGKDINNAGVNTIKAFLNDKGSVLFGHDTLHYSRNFWQFASYADVKKQNPVTTPQGNSIVVGGTHIQANREGLITQYPWIIGTDELSVPSTHTSFQMVNDKNTWIRFSRPSDSILPGGFISSGWLERLIQYDGYSNDAYLALNGNVGQIQTGHSNSNATSTEQKILANTLFYLSQLSTISETTITDNLALDVDNPTTPTITTHEFLNNGNQIKFNFTPSTDKGTEYSYYVKAEGQNDNAIRLSNTVKKTITSGIKGYSYVIDNQPNTVPNNEVDTTSSSITIDNNKGNSIYLHIKAIDNMGNVSETSHYQISDTTNPTLTITGNPTTWTNKDVVLNITASDIGTGVKEIVLPNGHKVTSSSTTYTVSSNGSYVFKVIDKMGNETSQTVVVDKIDKKINNIENLTSKMEMVNTSTSERKIIIDFNDVTDNVSGLKGYSYVIDKSSSTIPDNTIDTTSSLITKNITDTGLYYLHIKAIDNAGNISSIIHHKIDIPQLTVKAKPSDNMIRLDWTLDDKTGKTFKVFQKKENSNDFQTISTTNLEKAKEVKVLNIYPYVSTQITFTNWKNETFTLPKSASIKKWMEEPNAENEKGYGKGIISVDCVDIEIFNLKPEEYLKNSDGSWKYDVINIGNWDSNYSHDLTANTIPIIREFVEDGRGLLMGHDTVHLSTVYFKQLRDLINIQIPGDTKVPASYQKVDYVVYSDNVHKNKVGLLNNYPWIIDKDNLVIPPTHTSYQWAFGDVWFELDKNYKAPYGWGNQEYKGSDGNGTNIFYLTTWNNTALIQTGHSNGNATADEQKLLANTLFYLNQLSNDTFLNDNSGQDVKAPNKPTIYEHNFLGNGEVEFKFNEVVDNGSTYEYYVKSEDTLGNISLSNVVKTEIKSGLKGYSYVIDRNENTIPDDIIETPTAKTIKVKNSSDNLYVHIKAIDNVGNSSETLHYKISDVTKPTLELSLNTNSFTNGNVIINARATDSESGVKHIILPNGSVINGSTASYTVSANGVYYFKAIDYMGNETISYIRVSNIDKNKPIVTIQNNTNWTNQNVQVIITGTDE